MSFDIFLSYASEDNAKAVALARIFEADGWSVSAIGGTLFPQDVEIASAFSQAKAVVVLWSAISVVSSRVKSDAEQAKEAGRLVSVLLEDARIPLGYRALHTMDLRQWPGELSIPAISMLKAAVRRLLHNGASMHKPDTRAAPADMSLSVRVATRAKMNGAVGGSIDAERVVLDNSLALERCITDILLDVLHTAPDTVNSKVDTWMMQLANVLQTPVVICNKVSFSRMNVSKMRSVNEVKVTAAQEKIVLSYVNEYCSQTDEHNLHLNWKTWPEGKMLCLPLAQHSSGREYAWFLSQAAKSEWSQATQERLLKLASGIQAGAHRGLTTR